MSKIFIDANILLDILLPSRTNHKKAKLAYVKICETYDYLATSENILTTIEYIATKNRTDCKTIVKFFKGLKETFEFYSFSDILEDSLNLYNQKCKNGQKVDFEDLLQIQCAIKNGCNAFLTEDRGINNKIYDIKILRLEDI